MKDGRESFDANKFSKFVESIYRKEKSDLQVVPRKDSADIYLEKQLNL